MVKHLIRWSWWYFQEEKGRQGDGGEAGGGGGGLAAGEDEGLSGSSGTAGPVRKRTKKYDIRAWSEKMMYSTLYMLMAIRDNGAFLGWLQKSWENRSILEWKAVSYFLGVQCLRQSRRTKIAHLRPWSPRQENRQSITFALVVDLKSIASFRKVSIAENLNCDYSDCEYSEVCVSIRVTLSSFHHSLHKKSTNQAEVL